MNNSLKYAIQRTGRGAEAKPFVVAQSLQDARIFHLYDFDRQTRGFDFKEVIEFLAPASQHANPNNYLPFAYVQVQPMQSIFMNGKKMLKGLNFGTTPKPTDALNKHFGAAEVLHCELHILHLPEGATEMEFAKAASLTCHVHTLNQCFDNYNQHNQFSSLVDAIYQLLTKYGFATTNTQQRIWLRKTVDTNGEYNQGLLHPSQFNCGVQTVYLPFAYMQQKEKNQFKNCQTFFP